MPQTIAVVGAGLVGLTTAYWLRRNGAEVRVIDAAPGPGLGTSFANGGMLTPSQANPWNAPGVWRNAVGAIGRADSPLMVRPAALPGLVGWGTRFVLESRPERYRANARRSFALGRYSLEQHRAILADTGIDCSRAAVGTVQIFHDEASLAAARAIAEMLAPDGLAFRVLDPDALFQLEPALRHSTHRPYAGIHFPDDESGDAHLFCQNLAEHLQQGGVEFLYDTPVERIEAEGGRLRALHGPRGRVGADGFVIAAASRSRALLRPFGIRLPIYPVRGYSLTCDIAAVPDVPRLPLVDMHRKVAVTPLGPWLRLAGTAEFGHPQADRDPDAAMDERRLALVRRDAREILPALREMPDEAMQPWTGLRPVTPTGFPIMGRRLDNLYLNTGHGPLGWTFAAGSGRIVADIVLRRTHDLAHLPHLQQEIVA
ncbi:FAD-dependent oxidoreductase [Roseomonas sp. GCM10028921]